MKIKLAVAVVFIPLAVQAQSPTPTNNVDHLKQLGGVPDTHFGTPGTDQHVNYPSQLPMMESSSKKSRAPESASRFDTPGGYIPPAPETTKSK